ncbi:hypothetical protein SAMN05216337_101776 [Bradyrhizobium brasilense]|uniref:Tyr recombinase domain-containing protein n=1 Tax=Bradyrhizobium brasilense TaxID=1419277 RepID=A0A1G6YU64_9BRAD|nr:hypothetical protein [Bradyrhizobium brasilense]SDD93185.1 hypothetical protein SAMN05216337_101776 [Bradyrhizobium brasilense]
MNLARPLPRFVRTKESAGAIRYYWELPTYYKKLGCTLHKEHDCALGANYEAACTAATTLNGLFDDWDRMRLGEPPKPKVEIRAGTVDWLFKTYKASNDWKERVSARVAPDYDHMIKVVSDAVGKSGIRIGDRMVTSITPVVADKLYARIRSTPARKGKTERPRTAEKIVVFCRRAWRVVHRLHPGLFIQGAQGADEAPVWNPWEGVAVRRRKKATKPAATREQVYAFAWGAIKIGQVQPAAAAVICFEWLQRPENVLAGYVTWTGYRSKDHPAKIRIEHHKTGEMVLHPLEETAEGETVLFYEEAEQVLSHLPKLGTGLIMKPGRTEKHVAQVWDIHAMGRHVRKLRELLGLPDTFTLDACRHGGMTELEEAELTDGQGRALSAHKSKAYEGYAKRTEKRVLAATRKRYAHVLATQEVAESPAPIEPPVKRKQRAGNDHEN